MKTLLIIIMCTFFIGCQGEIGPEGVTGPSGLAGSAGTNGTNGTDGSTSTNVVYITNVVYVTNTADVEQKYDVEFTAVCDNVDASYSDSRITLDADISVYWLKNGSEYVLVYNDIQVTIEPGTVTITDETPLDLYNGKTFAIRVVWWE